MIDKTTIGLNEAVETLTGHEEQEIEQRFGAQVSDLLELKPTMGMRGVAYALVARECEAQDTKNPKVKAYQHVMGLTIKQIAEFFPEDEADEVDLEQPVTPAGEGDDSAD